MNTQNTYSISEVVDKTGVSKSRIREWQAKDYLPEAHTISVGSRQHRRFTEQDIQVIKSIRDFQEQGFTLRAAAQKAKEVK